MKENDLISVIVPVYNVEKYLEKSVLSIKNQTYNNIEILLIDDGSTDSSSKICDKLAKNNHSIKVFHKKNGGLSDARNYGIKKSKGKYICFVDSDDLINNFMIEELYDSIIKNNAQVSVCNFKYIHNDKCNIKMCEKKEKIKRKIVLNKEMSLKMMVNLNEKFAVNVCNKMFEKKLFTDDCFFPVGRLYEDMIITTKILSKVSKVVYIDCDLYYYLQRTNSITKKFNKKEYDHIIMSKKVLNFIKINNPAVESYFTSYHAINGISFINKMIENNCVDLTTYKKIQQFIHINNKLIYNDENLSKIKKIQIKIFEKNIKLYNFIYKTIYKIKY